MMTDQDYMRRAIELAKHAGGEVRPNPYVGAVIVKDGRIIGEGYHAEYGKLHAERDAIAHLTEPAEGATLYVTLEPCCHYGKTPPCTEAILENGIARVVIGSRDPNPKVAGKGTAILKEHGVTVEEDFLREQCDQLNAPFFHYITTGTPYLILKYAMTADGKIATKTGASKWITGAAAREEVQRIRSFYMGVMVGIGTVMMDDPMLNVRLDGLRSPIRIVCDTNLRIPLDSRICQTAKEYPTIVACAGGDVGKMIELEKLGVDVTLVKKKNGHLDLIDLMKKLGEKKIDSILVEGGGTLNDNILQEGLAGKVLAFVAPKIFGGELAKTPVAGRGVKMPDEAVKLRLERATQIGEDLMLEYIVQRRQRCLQES